LIIFANFLGENPPNLRFKLRKNLDECLFTLTQNSFLLQNICHFSKNIKKEFSFTSSLYFEIKITKICYNFLQYERVIIIFYFLILNISKFG
jgi:hypothetical protein